MSKQMKWLDAIMLVLAKNGTAMSPYSVAMEIYEGGYRTETEKENMKYPDWASVEKKIIKTVREYNNGLGRELITESSDDDNAEPILYQWRAEAELTRLQDDCIRYEEELDSLYKKLGPGKRVK